MIVPPIFDGPTGVGTDVGAEVGISVGIGADVGTEVGIEAVCPTVLLEEVDAEVFGVLDLLPIA